MVTTGIASLVLVLLLHAVCWRQGCCRALDPNHDVALADKIMADNFLAFLQLSPLTHKPLRPASPNLKKGHDLGQLDDSSKDDDKDSDALRFVKGHDDDKPSTQSSSHMPHHPADVKQTATDLPRSHDDAPLETNTPVSRHLHEIHRHLNKHKGLAASSKMFDHMNMKEMNHHMNKMNQFMKNHMTEMNMMDDHTDHMQEMGHGMHDMNQFMDEMTKHMGDGHMNHMHTMGHDMHRRDQHTRDSHMNQVREMDHVMKEMGHIMKEHMDSHKNPMHKMGHEMHGMSSQQMEKHMGSDMNEMSSDMMDGHMNHMHGMGHSMHEMSHHMNDHLGYHIHDMNKHMADSGMNHMQGMSQYMTEPMKEHMDHTGGRGHQHRTKEDLKNHVKQHMDKMSSLLKDGHKDGARAHKASRGSRQPVRPTHQLHHPLKASQQGSEETSRKPQPDQAPSRHGNN